MLPAGELPQLRLDALPRQRWPYCVLFQRFSALLEALTQLSNVFHCPVNATTHDEKVRTRERSLFFQKCLNNRHYRYDQLSAPDNHSAMACMTTHPSHTKTPSLTQQLQRQPSSNAATTQQQRSNQQQPAATAATEATKQHRTERAAKQRTKRR